MCIHRKTIGQEIKAARIRKGLTQKDVSEKLGIRQATLSIIENGNRNYTVDVLIKIYDFLGIK